MLPDFALCLLVVFLFSRLRAPAMTTDAWIEAEAVPDWADPRRVAVWDAINEYAAACGGDTGRATIGGRRMDAVVGVERALRAYTNEPGPDGNRVLVPERAEAGPVPLAARPSFWVLLFAAVALEFVYLWAIN